MKFLAVGLFAAGIATSFTLVGSSSTQTTITPGQSWDAVYQAASAGDTIVVAAGSYGSQTINDRTNLAVGSAPIRFQAAAGATVNLTDLTVRTHDLIVDGSSTSSSPGSVAGDPTPNANGIQVAQDVGSVMNAGQGNRNVAFEDVHARNLWVTAWGTAFRYGEIGPNNICTSGQSDLVQFWGIGTTGVQAPTLEYNDIHDNNQQACLNNGDHPDALQDYPVGGSSANVVIRGNHFWWCGTQCIFLGDGKFPNALLERNFVEETAACGNCGPAREVNVDLDSTGLVKCNTFQGGVYTGSAVVDNTNCSAPPPPPPTTTAPTTTAPTTTASSTVTVTTIVPGPTTTVTTTVSDYTPACKPDCDAMIAAVRAWYASAPVWVKP